MRILKRIVAIVVSGLLLLVVVGGLGLYWRAKNSLPTLDGTLSSDFLSDAVTIRRDEWGVPHITAENETDAYFALGFSHAQDRLFQMELFRRLAKGELAELLGPMVVPIDKIARSFRLAPKATEYYTQQSARYPELKAAAEAYVAGVNHCLDTEPLPFEYTALQIPVRPFTPVDCLTVGAILPITFADGIREDPTASILAARHPNLPTKELFPGYSKQTPATIMETFEEAAQFLAQRDNPPADADAAEAEPVAEEVALEQLSALLDALNDISGLYGNALGSNSWAVSGEKSKSGMPILCNDPHIGFTNPGIWYEAHMTYPGYDAYGYHLALIPFALLGHNRHHAWALTMFANDDVDMYVEKFDEDDPSRVMYKGQWQDALVEEETIKVRLGADVTTKLRVTPHGPVVTDLLGLMMGYEGPDVSLSWVWQHLDYTDMQAFYQMGKAQSYDEFQEGVSLVTSPGVNVTYADADGNIAWWAAGRIPIRPAHVNNKSLLDGASGNDELVGYVPFAENPHLKNPPWGYIVTANNKSTVKPVGAVEDLEGYWQPWDRAARIEEMLESTDKWDPQMMMKAQQDDKAYFGPEVVGAIMGVLKPKRDAMSLREQQALDALESWNFLHGTENVGATVHWAFNEKLKKHALLDEMGEKVLATYDTLADSFNFYKYFVHTPELPFWDDVNTDAVETREDTMLASFRDAVATLSERFGEDVNDWTWGKAHTMTFTHPLGFVPGLGGIFNIGPFPASGSHHVVNNMIAHGADAHYDVVAGPSTRRVIDFGNVEESFAILPTGNSGHFLSPNYDDQAEMFMRGEYREIVFTEEQIEASKKHALVLTPAK